MKTLDELSIPLVFVVPEHKYDNCLMTKQIYTAVKSKGKATSGEKKEHKEPNCIYQDDDNNDDGCHDRFTISSIQNKKNDQDSQDSQDIVNTQEINLNRYPELRNLKQAVIKIEEQMMMNLLATKTEKHEKST